MGTVGLNNCFSHFKFTFTKDLLPFVLLLITGRINNTSKAESLLTDDLNQLALALQYSKLLQEVRKEKLS